MLALNGFGASLGGDFRPVYLSPVKKVKDNINCQNTTKAPLEFGTVLEVVALIKTTLSNS